MEPTPPTLLHWTVLCALAEGVGMTAAAGAARTTEALADRPGLVGTVWVALGIIVAGGLVEGAALGLAQAWPLGRWLPALRRGRYVVATILVAGVGWALGSAPATLADGEEGTAPSLAVLLLGGVGLGLLIGLVLGAVQAAALHVAVPHPWRWIGANAAAWPAAMALICLGASSPRDLADRLGAADRSAHRSRRRDGARTGLVAVSARPGRRRPGGSGIPAAVRRLSRLACSCRLTTQEGLIGFDLGR